MKPGNWLARCPGFASVLTLTWGQHIRRGSQVTTSTERDAGIATTSGRHERAIALQVILPLVRRQIVLEK